MAAEGAKATLVAIMKDERPYILEWVAYHRLIGFDDIVIYSHDSTDGSRELLDALHRHGILTHRLQQSSIGVKPQVAAYRDAVSRCKTEWIVFLDADEFLALKADTNVKQFIARFARASPRDFVTNFHVKSILKVQDIEIMLVHSAILRQGKFANSSGEEVSLIKGASTPSVVADLAQINHYFIKSKQEFERKKRRGRADFPPEHPELYTTRTDEVFADHDRNEDEDVSLCKFRDAIEREIARLQALVDAPQTAASVLLVGVSHVTALKNAQAARVAGHAAIFDLPTFELVPKYLPIVAHVEGRQALMPDIEPDLRGAVEASPPACVIGAFWGDQHFFMSTANLPRRLDFVLPAEPDLPLDPGAEIVPYDLICDYVRYHCVHVQLLIEATLRVTRAPLYLLPAPPPVADFAAIPGGSSSKHIDGLVAQHGVAPAWLRYKFWRLVSDVYNQMAAAAGAKALPTPPESQAPDGFRRAEYDSTDWIHGNARYGELVLRQIDALLAAKAES